LIYKKAKLDAIAETGLNMPDVCPYTFGDVLEQFQGLILFFVH